MNPAARVEATDAAQVVVVGSGPAGAAAAIVSASAGLETILLESVEFPRPRSGETLHPGVESAFRRLGVAERVAEAGFLRYEGIWTDWDGVRRFAALGSDAAGPWRGMHADGATLDSILLERARESGVRVVQPSRALDPVCGPGGRVVGVRTDRGTIGATVAVVDAAGGRHWLARRLGLPRVAASPPLQARFGYAGSPPGASDATPSLTADDDGWTWSALVRPGVRHWTRLQVRPRAGGPARPAVVDGMPSLGQVLGRNVTWRRVARAAGSGFFMVGDAAFVLDPASSHGVLKALLSGILAGQLAAETVAGGTTAGDAADIYASWIERWFAHDTAVLATLYERFGAWRGPFAPRDAARDDRRPGPAPGAPQ